MEYGQRAARLPKTNEERLKWQRLTIILEHCPLKQVQDGKDGWVLLTEKHKNHHAKHNQDPAVYRPDVVHQCLLHLLDSPLNRAGKLQVFLRTNHGVLIQVDPRLRIPRCPRLFDKMMVRLLHKFKIRSTANFLSLLRVIKNPVTDHLPQNSRFIRVEKDGRVVDLFDYCAQLASCCGGTEDKREKNAKRRRSGTKRSREQAKLDSIDSDEEEKEGDRSVVFRHVGTAVVKQPTKSSPLEQAPESEDSCDDTGSEVDLPDLDISAPTADSFKPFVFVIGGTARGDVDVEYAPTVSAESNVDWKNDCIALSGRGLSAAAVCSQIVHAFENVWLE